MKKVIALVLASVLLSGIFAGCGANPSSNNTAPSAGSTAGNVTSASTEGSSDSSTSKKNITITFGSHQSGLPSSGIVQKIAQEYEQKTGVKIDFQITPDAQWKDVIKTKLATGEAPDMFCVDTGTLEQEYHVSKNCADLTNESWVSRMDKTAIPMVTVNDKVYAISFPGYKVWWYYYNKKMFSDLGLKAPTSYQEFKDVCAKIKATGVTPIYEAVQDGWHQQLPLYETGGFYSSKYPNLYNDLNTHKKTLNDIPELKTVVTEMQEFAKLGYFGSDYMSNSVANDEKAFADGKAAMVLEGFGWEQQLNKDFPDTTGNVGFFVMPWADSQVLGISPPSNGYLINANSKYVTEAKAFFSYLAQPEVLKERLEGDPSALALCWPEIPAKYPKSYSDYIDTLKKEIVMQVAVPYTGMEWMDVGKDVAAMYSGAMTPDTLIKNMQQRIDDQAKLMKDPNWN